MPLRAFLFPALLLTLIGCRPQPQETALLEGPALALWQQTAVADSGALKVEPGLLTLPAGKPMTGARLSGWESLKLPVTDYELTFEAQRVEGRDFFAAVTFPVRRLDTCATLVLGGWGGALVGISSIDDLDASENSTRSEQSFNNHQWYHIRLQVTNDEIKAWIDERLVVNTSIKARKISLRPGDIELCAPFGFASYGTAGQVRGLAVRRL